MKGRKRGLRAFVRFMETKGFYPVLGMCVLAVALTGYLLFGSGGEPGNVVDQEDVLQDGQLELPDPSLKDEEPSDPDGEQNPDAEDTQTQKPPVDQDTSVDNKVEVPAAAYTQPVSGKVIREFSGDTLVKDDTMGDWRTHNGTDFACGKNAEAKAFAAGTVLKVEERGLYGLCITIDHGKGLVSTLAGLGTSRVKSGDKVRCGQVIGLCAGNLEAESAQESHVHLEVQQGKKYIDPMGLILE